MAQMGGKRPGAGRKPGKVGAAKQQLMQMAKEHAQAALETLVDVAKNGDTASSRVSAANAILDRAYGRPPQSVEHTGEGGGAIQAKVSLDISKISTNAMKEILDASANEG